MPPLRDRDAHRLPTGARLPEATRYGDAENEGLGEGGAIVATCVCATEGVRECPEHRRCPPCPEPGDCYCDQAIRFQQEIEARNPFTHSKAPHEQQGLKLG